VAVHLEELSEKESQGIRKLPISSSPEIHNNSAAAWFSQTTNFDLALILWTFEKAAELAHILELDEERARWLQILDEWPDLALHPEQGLMIAPGIPLTESHRHFSHLMAFHPLGLIDWAKGKENQRIIQNTLDNLDNRGTEWWVGYSFAWLGNLKARAMNGEGAEQALLDFANCFCLPNSFHVNGDQTRSGKSKFTYRPFTIEGNFAFAAGIQEMLIQSHAGFIRLFPAIPEKWENVGFKTLRTEGAFLVSATMKQGEVIDVRIRAEQDGMMRMACPFSGIFYHSNREYRTGDIIEIEMKKGQVIELNHS
jgi:alpha-L-fucosidase 2